MQLCLRQVSSVSYTITGNCLDETSHFARFRIIIIENTAYITSLPAVNYVLRMYTSYITVLTVSQVSFVS
jgi:hypothetical protein